MKAKLVTYTTKKLNKSEKSLLSKKLYGYIDKSNRSRYTYKREGLLHNKTYLKVCNNTFIITAQDWPVIEKELKKRRATIKVWDISLKNV